MSRRQLAILLVCTLLVTLLVAWLGSEHGEVARAFLRNLLHTLRRAL